MSPESSKPFVSRPCPACKAPSVEAYRPFCSRGCRDRDLIGWFDEQYRIPVAPAADEGDDPDAMPTRD